MKTKKIIAGVIIGALTLSSTFSLIDKPKDIIAKNESTFNYVKPESTVNIINNIDKLIYKENNILKIDTPRVNKIIIDNWATIQSQNPDFKTPEEFYSYIEKSINNINEKINSGYYELNNNNELHEKYQNREWYHGYERYEKWWGFQFYARSNNVENLARDLEYTSYQRGIGVAALEGLGVFTGGVTALLGVFCGITAGNFAYMATRVRQCVSDYGSVKLSVYITGSYFTTEPIQ